jgi:hypothetical protein
MVRPSPAERAAIRAPYWTVKSGVAAVPGTAQLGRGLRPVSPMFVLFLQANWRDL